MSRRHAVIAVGTNSTRVLLADVARDVAHVDLARSIGTRIGEGLDRTGALGEEPLQRTYEAVRQLQHAIRGRYVRLFAIATSAVRRASNAAAFAERMHELLGVPLRVLSGDEEAAAAYRGAITALVGSPGACAGVVDLGGGSTEYAVGTAAEPQRVVSCEIGAVRLTEAVPELAGRDGPVETAAIERARALAREALAPLDGFPPVDRLAFAGGTATTAAQILLGRRAYVAAFPLARPALQRLLLRLCAMTLDERKALGGMKPQRADILAGGIVVLDTLLDMVGRDTAIVTAADLLLGFLLQQRDGAPVAAPAFPSTTALHGRPL